MFVAEVHVMFIHSGSVRHYSMCYVSCLFYVVVIVDSDVGYSLDVNLDVVLHKCDLNFHLPSSSLHELHVEVVNCQM